MVLAEMKLAMLAENIGQRKERAAIQRRTARRMGDDQAELCWAIRYRALQEVERMLEQCGTQSDVYVQGQIQAAAAQAIGADIRPVGVAGWGSANGRMVFMPEPKARRIAEDPIRA